MHKSKSPKSLRMLGITLLLLVCIVVCELIVCSYADPELYNKIMTPVRATCQQILDKTTHTFSQMQDQVSQWWGAQQDRWQQRREERRQKKLDALLEAENPQATPESQLAGDPDLTENGGIAADPAITELVDTDTGQILTGGIVDLVYFAQTDPRWSDKPYGGDDIGRYACGPTVMAMVVSSLTDETIDPQEMAGWAYRNGYHARRSGSYHSIVAGTAAAYGLQAEPFRNFNAQALRKQLSSGRGVMVALMTKGHFTNGGHFIILRGMTLDGSILVADPYSPERSLQTWDAQLILDELSRSRDSGAPLWLITTPNQQ